MADHWYQEYGVHHCTLMQQIENAITQQITIQ